MIFKAVFYFLALTRSCKEVMSGPFGDVGGVTRHHDRTIAVTVVPGNVARVATIVLSHLLHQIQNLWADRSGGFLK